MPIGTDDAFDLSRVLVLVHWLGMLMGLGSAATADALGARVMLSIVPGPRPRVLRRLHATIIVAMVLLVFSGAGLIVLRSEQWCALPENVIRIGPFCLPYKLAVKLMLMTILVSIALMIETLLLPLAHRPDRPLVKQLSAFEIARSIAIVSASFTCWVTLAAIPQMKSLHAWAPLAFLSRLALIWMAMSIAATIAMLVIRAGLRAKEDGRLGGRAALVPEVARGATMTGQSVHFAGLDVPPLSVVPAGRIAGEPERSSPRTVASDAASIRRTVERQRPQVAVANLLWPAVWGAFAISFVINILMLSGPLYMLQIYDRVLASRSSQTLLVLSLLMLGLFFVLGVLDVIRSKVLARVALRLDAILSEPLLSASVKVGAKARADQQLPVRDLDQLRQFVAGPAVPALLDLPWAPLYFALVFLLHPILGMLAVAGCAVLLSLSVLNQTMTRKPMAASAAATGRCDGLVEAGWRGAETLRALGMNASFRRRWAEAHTNALVAQLRAGDCASRITISIKVVRMLIQSMLLGAGAWLALHDAVSAGAMIAVSVIAGRALVPIEQIVGHWRGIANAMESFKRCRTLLSSKEAPGGAMDLPAPRGELSVSGLYVAPIGTSHPVIKGISFNLAPGDALAVVGPSATGKSTLAKALVGAWPARAGDIRLDGAALSQWDADVLGRHIGYLPQDALLFDGTISDNIARLDPQPDSNAVIAAAREAGVHEMILRLEHGYMTRVGDGGAALSGGQRQRIALARALYGSPALIVMDEPNANLDAAGEEALIEAIVRLRAARRTVVVMAHRRSVITAVNLVLVLNEGRQVGFGPPSKVFKSEKTTAKEYRNDNRITAARAVQGLAG